MSNKKYGNILRELRLKIVNGTFSIGERLPSRIELQKEFDVSNQTIQVAINSLKNDGFLVTNGSGGTSVSEKPPHLYNYGIVSCEPFSGSRYTRAVQETALGLCETEEYSFTCYSYEKCLNDSEGFRKLAYDVESHRVAGLIFVTPPYGLERTPALLQSGLPRVMNSTPTGYSGIPRICPDGREFLGRAVDYLVGQGRKNIALIGTYHNRSLMEENIDYMLERGLGAPELVHECSTARPWSATQAVLVMMKLSENNRPDALIILDDNLVEAATEGLAKSDLRIPQDVAVVAHCNFPDRPPSCVPVTRLGLDCTDLLMRDMECLKAQRLGKKIRKDSLVPFVFESEIAPRTTDVGRQRAESGRAAGSLKASR